MKQSARPKYQQPQLDNNRSLADQASANNVPQGRLPSKTTAKVSPIKPATAASRKIALGNGRVHVNGMTVAVLLFAAMIFGTAIGVPLGAWLFAHGVRVG